MNTRAIPSQVTDAGMQGIRRCRPALGTYVEIRIDALSGVAATAADEAAVNRAIDHAFAAIARVQELMSVHDPESELSQVNRLAHLFPVPVDPWTQQVLQLAQSIHRASAGLFDCAIAPRLVAWGLLPSHVAASAAGPSTFANLEISDSGKVFAAAPTVLDLGGIAKGFAVDKAAEALLQYGVSHAVINAGGDLRVIGDQDMPIYIRAAVNPQQLQLAGMLSDGAFASSGSYFSAEQANRAGVSALVNPKDGTAIVSPHSFSVIAPSCAVADALTKVLAVSGDPSLPCFAAFDAHPLMG